MKKLLLFFTIAISLLLCQTACVREDDFSGLDDLQYQLNPVLGMPLITGSLGMENLLNTAGTENLPTEIYMSQDGYYIISYTDTFHVKSDGTILSRRPLRTKAGMRVSIPIKDTIDISFFQNESVGNIKLNAFFLDLKIKSNEEIDAKLYDSKVTLIKKDGSTQVININNQDTISLHVTGIYQQFINENIAPELSSTNPITKMAYSSTIDIDTSAINDFENLSLDFAASAKIGLYGYAENLVYTDTLDFSLNMEQSDIDSITKFFKVATFYYGFSNGFPFNLGVQLYFLDANYKVKDSLFISPNGLGVLSSGVDANGNATTPTLTSSFDKDIKPGNNNKPIQKTGEHIKKLLDSKHIVIRAGFSTKDAELKKLVKISDKNRLGLDLTVKVQTLVNQDLVNSK